MKHFYIIFFLLTTNVSLIAQCQFNLDSYTHVNCFSENTGSIDISFSDPNISFWWTGPNGYTSNSTNLSLLYAGDYVLTIIKNIIPGDTSSQLLCSNLDIYGNPKDTITIEETSEIQAIFDIEGQCNMLDSANVYTSIIGGTPPHSVQWSNGVNTLDNYNLHPNPLLPYSLIITDNNGCQVTKYLKIDPIPSMKTFSSFVGVICKDDKSAEARVFVSDGNPPFTFIWSNDDFTESVDSSASTIYNLTPGLYSVMITDNNSCVSYDTVEIPIESNVCLNPTKVFSPNNDGINDIWEIENIDIYPSALIEIYSKNGYKVFRRRNYQNSVSESFNGTDLNGNTLPSSTYYYVISIDEINDVYKGTITIVR